MPQLLPGHVYISNSYPIPQWSVWRTYHQVLPLLPAFISPSLLQWGEVGKETQSTESYILLRHNPTTSRGYNTPSPRCLAWVHLMACNLCPCTSVADQVTITWRVTLSCSQGSTSPGAANRVKNDFLTIHSISRC